MTSSVVSLLGSQTPRLCSLPAGVVSHAPGEAAIRQAAAAGLVLDEWQQLVLREALGVRADGKWAAFSTCLIVPRQNGKGSILEALALAALFQFDVEYTVWTAHQMKTAKQGFQRLWSLIRQTPDLMRQVERARFGNDDRGIDLKDGRQIRFLARGAGSGVGFTADLVILDEAYKLDSDVMSDLLPTMSAVPNPQIWYTSSACHASSEQLHAVRSRGLAGNDPRLAFFEWSVDPENVDPRSEEAWALANPAYPHRIDREAIESEWNEFNADVDVSKFARERLGIPDDLIGESSVVSLESWDALEDPGSESRGRTCLALDVSPDRKWASVCEAGRREDGLVHVETVDRRPGTGWVVDALPGLLAVAGCEAVRVEKGGPAGSLIGLLTEAGVEVIEVSVSDHARATGQFIDAVNAGTLRHLGQQSLRSAIAGAQLRASGDAELWGRRTSSADVTPLVAASLAMAGLPEGDEPLRVWSLADFPDLV